LTAVATAAAAAAPKPPPAPKSPPAPNKRKQGTQSGSGGETSGGENEEESEGEEENAVQRKTRKGRAEPRREKAPFSNDTRVIQSRHTNQLRKHMKNWYIFISYYQALIDFADGGDVCNYHPTDNADLEMPGALARPGKIGSESTNTQELTSDFIVRALPNCNQNNLSPRVVLRFEDPLQDLINTYAPELRVRESKKSSGGSDGCCNKRQRTDNYCGGSSAGCV
jgi:hypothetical protein